MRIYDRTYDNPIIEIDKVYEIKGASYRVITAVAGVGVVSRDEITLAKPVYIVEHAETGERFRISENELREEIK